MTHLATAIANEFLMRAQKQGVQLTNMHVQKLVYIAHGWNLAVNNEPLIDEPFFAWDFGPVAQSLYKALRRYGPDTVTRLIRLGDETPGDFSDDGEAARAILTSEEKQVIDDIWKEFKDFEAFQLSELTHKDGSPWHKTYNGRDHGRGKYKPIADFMIQDHFSEMADQP